MSTIRSGRRTPCANSANGAHSARQVGGASRLRLAGSVAARKSAWVALAAPLALAACSGSSDGTTGTTTGAGASGQASSSVGGATQNATTLVATGGTTIASSIGTGGLSANGGAPAVGGAPSAQGGSTADVTTTTVGGASSKGGATSSGGTTSKGGATSSGGMTSKGGATSSGGMTSKGGATSSGGGTAVSSVGCGKTSTLTFGTVPGESGQTVGIGEGGYVTVQSSGQTRGFALRLPDNYDKNKPYPLIFGFHWNGGNSKEVDTGGSNGYNMSHFGLQKMSNNGAIFVAPQGIGNGWANSGGQDLKFVDDMVKLIEDNYCVDTARLFANGFSYGGGMSYAIACGRAKVFRGVAIYDGAQLSGCEGGSDPIAYWQMAGLTDTTCTVAMGTPMRDRFVKNNGCTVQTPPQPPMPPPYLSMGGHICTNYSGCSSGHPVRWCVHQSGHGNAVVDGTSDLWNSCATAPKTCSASCPCTWVPGDVWQWMNSL